MMRTSSDWLVQRNATYQTRRDQATAVLEQLGLQVWRPKAMPALWAGVPAGYTSEEIAALLLGQVGVLIAPGTAFGPRGEGYIQLSLTVEETRFQEALARLRRVLLPARGVTRKSEGEESQESAVGAGADPAGEEHGDAC
jgi:LL-diaminopimelate aminotransferase